MFYKIFKNKLGLLALEVVAQEIAAANLGPPEKREDQACLG